MNGRRSPRNPTRRNRNIGTSASGHGHDNRLVIPSRFNGPIWYWRDLGEYKTVKRSIQGREVTFLVERTNRGCIHACTVDDIARLLSRVPLDDWEGLALIILRQPKRKEAVLSGMWGRLAYGGEIGRPQDGMFRGPAIFLESAEPDFSFSLNASMRPAARAEFERLTTDGHTVTRQGSRFLVRCSLETIRNTQLYRTVLHEIGHWVDWLQKVERPVAPKEVGEDEWNWRQELQEKYDQRPPQEREAFANQYADRMRAELVASGAVPFPRQPVSPDLDPVDFIPGFKPCVDQPAVEALKQNLSNAAGGRRLVPGSLKNQR
jgi:hypothetical protein